MCTKNQLNEIMTKLTSKAKIIFGDSFDSMILFGSYARGDYDEESDIDVLILADVNAEEILHYRDYIDSLCGELLWEYGIVVSAIEKDTETYNRYSKVLPFYKNIETEGVRIA